MRWCFWTQMEDLERMEVRASQVLDRMQTEVIALSSVELDSRIFLSGVMKNRSKTSQTYRIASEEDPRQGDGQGSRSRWLELRQS